MFEKSNQMTMDRLNPIWIANAIENMKEFGSLLGYDEEWIKERIEDLETYLPKD
jgi:hypothetical protein